MLQALCICYSLLGSCNPKLPAARVETGFVQQRDVKLFHWSSIDLRGLVHISKFVRRGLRRVENIQHVETKALAC